MKKIISLIAVLFTAIVLTGCFGELNSLEWSQLPESVYDQVEDESDHASAVEDFMAAAKVKINGKEVTLKEAVENHGATVTGFDLTSEGSKVITVKYASLTIYWAYQVIDGEITPDEVTPTYGWYDDQSSPYTLASIGDLYGFANIVNGKRPDHLAHSFAGETVKLGVDIDLSGKVWEPIGASPRMANIALEVLSEKQTSHPTVQGKLYQFTDDNKWYVTYPNHKGEVANKVVSLAELENYSPDKEVKGLYFVDSYFYAVKKDKTTTAKTINDFDFYYSNDVPVGNFFQGTFDGQGHKITGLSDIGYTPTVVFEYANSAMIVTGYTFGLFGVVKDNVTVKNLTFEDITIVGAYYDSNQKDLVLAEIDSVGAAIGYAFGNGNLTVDNVKVLSGSITAQMAAAGIVGRFYNNGQTLIQNCENRANVSLTGVGYHVGGIAGYGANNTGTHFISNTNYGNITVTVTSKNPDCAGAMINYLGTGTAATNLFDNCRNFGNITGTSHALGLVNSDGQAVKIDIETNCVNYGVLQSNK